LVALSKLLHEGSFIEMSAKDKDAALRELAFALAAEEGMPPADRLLSAVLEREALHSTGICLGLAIPHCRLPEIRTFAMVLGRAREGIPYESMDNLPVRVVAMIAAPEGRQEDYLRLLSRVTKFLKHERERILSAPSERDLYPLVAEY